MSDLGNRTIMAANINYYMQLNHKTRKEVCDDLGFSYSTFCEWANGRKYPRIDKIEMLANYFNIEKSDLIEDKHKLESISEHDICVANKLAFWFQEVGTVNFTDDEVNKLISYAKFMLSQRGDK